MHPDVLTHWLVEPVQAFEVPVITVSQCQIEVLKTLATKSLLSVLLSDWVLFSGGGSVRPAPSVALIAGKEWARRTGDKRHECVCSCSSFLQIKYGDTATSEGVLFATYSALIGESQAGGQHRTRLKQILDWCRENFDGVVSF